MQSRNLLHLALRTGMNNTPRERVLMPKLLTAEEVAAFHENGYHAPVRVMSEAQALHYRRCLEGFMQRYPDDANKLDQGASLLCPWIDEFIRLPDLLDVMEDLIGPNILCWGVTLRLKKPDGKSFAGWHQDTAYSDIKPIVVIAALALSDASMRSGGLRVIPGTHTGGLLPHKENFGTANILSREQTIEAKLDTANAVDMPLRAGEAALFNNAICHASGPNMSDDQRILFIIEMIPTHAYQQEPRESAMLMRGFDEHGNFDQDPRPDAEMSPASLAAWRRKVAVQASVLYRGAAHETRAFKRGEYSE